LSLRVVEQTPTLIRLQIQLDGPIGIRRPVWIQLTSNTPAFSIASPPKSIQLTSRWLCLAISTGFVAIVYGALAFAVHTFYAHVGAKPRNFWRHGWRILDPAVVSAGDYGTASLANLQILWFSLIVAWIVAFAWLVTGELLGLSPQILALLGITGGVNVVATSLTSGKQRVSLDNWNWLVEKKLLRPEVDIDPILVAQWRDFVVDRGVLDPSRYQLIIFGFIVGIKLLFAETSTLKTFELPDFFLGLQGVSSGLYLFGKAVSPTHKDELEALITSLKTGSAEMSLDDKNSLRRSIESLYGPAALGDALKPLESSR
jgi:hypothetical protein